MSIHILFEIIGYMGTAFVLFSFLMTSVFKLRVINSIGSFISIIYGLVIHAYPTVFLNAALLIINCIYLAKMQNHKVVFNIVTCNALDSSIKYFIESNKADILSFFPDVEKSFDKVDFVKAVYCKNEMVGVFAGHYEQNVGMNIILDYATKEYRDFSVGKELYESLKNEEFKKIIFNQKNNGHEKYLTKMGFEKRSENGENLFVKAN